MLARCLPDRVTFMLTMTDDHKTRGAAGGHARSAALSKAERRAIASKAAADRWAKQKKLPRETHTGALKFGTGITCSVLSNGMRVLSANGLERAFGSNAKGSGSRDELQLPAFLSAANLQPFISSDLRQRLGSPVEFNGMHGGRIALGYEADILARICDVLLDARAAGVLRQTQAKVAAAAELMMRGFAHVGIIALIDEVTGYQAERARDELHRILEQYISKELLPWTKKFPDEFFEQIYRVHSWKYMPGNTQRPGYVGKFINRYVYEALPDGVIEELRRKNPPVNGHRRHKHFQLLTDHTGDPHLDRQIVATTTIMKLADNKADFHAKFQKLYPRSGDQVAFEFEDVSTEEGQPGVTVGTRGLTMSALQDGNTWATKDLARHVYQSETETALNKMRKFLSRLRDEGLVESPSPGLWRRPANSPV